MNEIFSNKNVKSKNIENSKNKIKQILKDGINHMHVITDFDMTLTKYWDIKNNRRSVSSHGILHQSTLPSSTFKKICEDLYSQYYPMEVSTTLPFETKVAAMYEWTSKANEAIKNYGFSKSDLAKMVKEIPVVFRDGAQLFSSILEENDIPLLIFSAGLGDIIKEILIQHNFNIPTMHIVSNMMIFDEKGICVGFNEPLVHVFNKNEANIRNTEYFKEIEAKKNVILLGDSLGDPHMSAGLDHDTVFKIGYLNHDVNENLEKYLDIYDVVILNDSAMDFINGVLSLLVNGDLH